MAHLTQRLTTGLIVAPFYRSVRLIVPVNPATGPSLRSITRRLPGGKKTVDKKATNSSKKTSVTKASPAKKSTAKTEKTVTNSSSAKAAKKSTKPAPKK